MSDRVGDDVWQSIMEIGFAVVALGMLVGALTQFVKHFQRPSGETFGVIAYRTDDKEDAEKARAEGSTRPKKPVNKK